jgi:hypothetical protein
MVTAKTLRELLILIARTETTVYYRIKTTQADEYVGLIRVSDPDSDFFTVQVRGQEDQHVPFSIVALVQRYQPRPLPLEARYPGLFG